MRDRVFISCRVMKTPPTPPPGREVAEGPSCGQGLQFPARPLGWRTVRQRGLVFLLSKKSRVMKSAGGSAVSFIYLFIHSLFFFHLFVRIFIFI